MATETRTVRLIDFLWVDGDGQAQLAKRGEEVKLPKEEAERGDRLGAFVTDEDEEPERSFADFTVSELADWIKNERPTVNEVIEASQGDGDLAHRLLDAESTATGGDPRKGVVAGLEAVIGRAH